MEYVASLSSAVMAIVWIVYFQLFFRQYRRNSRPYLVIHHAQNEDPDALCLLVNMSMETVHIQTVQVVLHKADENEQVLVVTEYQRLNAGDGHIPEQLRQGPLASGGYLVLGSFRDILLGRQSSESDSDHLFEDITAFEIRAVVIHGPSRFPVGVRRHFSIHHQGRPQIFPRNIHSEQLCRRRDHAEVRLWLEAELRPVRTGRAESDSSNQSH